MLENIEDIDSANLNNEEYLRGLGLNTQDIEDLNNVGKEPKKADEPQQTDELSKRVNKIHDES